MRTLGLRGASAQRSLCGDALVFVWEEGGGARRYGEQVKIYYSEVKRWKRLNKRLPIIDIYQGQKGAVFDCSFFCCFFFLRGNVLGNLRGELQGGEHTHNVCDILHHFNAPCYTPTPPSKTYTYGQ